MKIGHPLLLAALAIAGLFVVSTNAMAQTCASPIALPQGASGTGNTCAAPTGQGTNEIGQYCGVVGSPENEIIYTVTIGAGASATFDVTGVAAGFNPAIVLFQAADASACQVASNCIGLPSDANGNGGNETLTLTGNPAGSYFIAVTGSPGSNTCGAYGYAVTGTLPVKLESFSVQ